MRYENLRWLLVVAGIAVLVVVHQSNRTSKKPIPLDEQPAGQMPELVGQLTVVKAKDVLEDALPMMNRLVDIQDSAPEIQQSAEPSEIISYPDSPVGADEFRPLGDLAVDENGSDTEFDIFDLPGQESNDKKSDQPYLAAQESGHIIVNVSALPGQDAPDNVLAAMGYRVTNPMFDQADNALANESRAQPPLNRQPLEAKPSSFAATPTLANPGTTDFQAHPAINPQPRESKPLSYAATPTLADPNPMKPASIESDTPQPQMKTSVTNGNTPRPIRPNHYVIPRGVETRAVHHIEYGKSLARRGAFFAARQEFYNALRMVAEAIDIQTDSKNYSTGLVTAFVALNEADDFYRHQSNIEQVADVAAISISHRTQALSPDEKSQMSAAQAMQAYYAYAQDLLVRSSGHSVVAGEALFCLGRLYTLKANNDTEGTALDYARAIVHHRAALACDRNHYRSANEIGVLLAKTGQLRPACDMFKESLRIRQLPQTWKNLAVVHQRLGEMDLARLADQEYQRILSGPPVSQMAQSIQWVTPQEFKTISPQESQDRTADQKSQSGSKAKSKSEKNFLSRMNRKLF